FGVFLAPILFNIGFNLSVFFVFGLILGFSVLAPLALWLMYYLSRFLPFLRQFARFAAVGSLNFILYLSVLNFFIAWYGKTNGIHFIIFTSVAFLIVATNSYLWNKFWTFQSDTALCFGEYIKFAAFTLIGFLINVGTASFINNFIGPSYGISPKIWANISALIAVLTAFIWNFLGYKHVVFKKAKIIPVFPDTLT
ncbi:MAG: GtrA family protein, partial [Candidatus Brennerbacteria bacterium]|nr:GtrA family protein [Candidatus Brennerbacteria bacterium]